MPATTEAPTVALSFANNFWGKDDAGVAPLLERMQSAKLTNDELKAFYGARASIEDDYAKKLLALSRKSLGSHETGALKTSLDTVRGELDSMAKQHGSVAAQMKTELEEPLAAFAGGMKERRKIVQSTVEKLLKIKVQQTQTVNKTRDRYEQECLKIKGYLAQGHMVMGQEERKNKAKLEKTQINLATSNTEYENAVKALEDTTARWNREWKAAADKFQDLEEERLDFTKSSLWTLANISSTVCVSDDASCEKVRLSLEKVEVEKDIIHFINEFGTSQEIPDPPKYINFCRGDVDEHESIASADDDGYSVAQFPRNINPVFRSASPQPSTFSSHNDPNSALARHLFHNGPVPSGGRDNTAPPRGGPPASVVGAPSSRRGSEPPQSSGRPVSGPPQPQQYDTNQFATVPHDPYPLDGMTMLCRTDGNNTATSSAVNSGLGSAVNSGLNSATSSNMSARPQSRDGHSDYSRPTSFSSQEPSSGKVSPIKQQPAPMAPIVEAEAEKRVFKKRSGFFHHSPFRRKSQKEIQTPSRNTWGPTSASGATASHGRQAEQSVVQDRTTASPEPIDGNASLALNVGQNVFPVSTPDRRKKDMDQGKVTRQEEQDPIALALAELKGAAGNKQARSRMSADHYHGISTPVPGQQRSEPQTARSMPAGRGHSNSDVAAGTRGTPPPSYDHQVQRLGVPAAAVTSKAMQATSRKYVDQTRDMFSPIRPGSGAGRPSPSTAGSYAPRSQSRPVTRGSNDVPRAASPAPPRNPSPRPAAGVDPRQSRRSASPNPYVGAQARYDPQMAPNGDLRQSQRAASPNPYGGGHQRAGSQVNMTPNGDPRQSQRAASPNPYGGGHQRAGSQVNMTPNGDARQSQRSASPNPYGGGHQRAGSQVNMTPARGSAQSVYGQDMARSASPAPSSRSYHSPGSSMHMPLQLAPAGEDGGYGSQRGRQSRPGTSQGGAMNFYDGRQMSTSRQRSKSVADPSRQYTPDGRPILHLARALYMYQAAIPEELSFGKGDLLAVLRHQDDGWWEAEIHAGNGAGRGGLVPSNYLQPC